MKMIAYAIIIICLSASNIMAQTDGPLVGKFINSLNSGAPFSDKSWTEGYLTGFNAGILRGINTKVEHCSSSGTLIQVHLEKGLYDGILKTTDKVDEALHAIFLLYACGERKIQR